MKRAYTHRHLEKVARDVLESHKILVLIGARQTGKSTLTRKLLKGVPESQKLLLNLDDPFLRDRLYQEGAVQRLVEERSGQPWEDVRGFHLVLDEAQKAPELFEIVKAIHDRDPYKMRFTLTGSSALAIHDPVAETLAGRTRILHLHPFTLSEGFAHAEGLDPTQDDLAAMVSALLRGRFNREMFDRMGQRARRARRERHQFVQQRLLGSLFPEPSLDSEPESWLRDYLAKYLEKDIASLSTIGNVDLFRNTLRQIAARVGSTVKWETAAQEIGTTSTTFRKYVGLMLQTFNLIRLGAFAVNPVKRVIKAPKLYFHDNGLLWALRGFEDRPLLEKSGMMGAYAEQLVICELAKWCSLEPTAPDLRFWTKSQVSEVGLVISNRGYHVPFEIKLGGTFDPRWLRGLDAFEADHRKLTIEIPYRVVVHFGEGSMPDERTFALPLWWFA